MGLVDAQIREYMRLALERLLKKLETEPIPYEHSPEGAYVTLRYRLDPVQPSEEPHALVYVVVSELGDEIDTIVRRLPGEEGD